MNQKKEDNYIDFEKLKREKLEKQLNRPDTKPDSLIGGWIIYIFVMIAGLIFNDYITLAIFATIVFFWWRHDEIEKDNGRWPPSEYKALKKQIAEEAKQRKVLESQNIDRSVEAKNCREDEISKAKSEEEILVIETASEEQVNQPVLINKIPKLKSEAEKARKNRLQRIGRRKAQVKQDLDKAVSLIEKGTWCFKSEISSEKNEWQCIDADGIRIVGKVNKNSTSIKFVFPSETINVKDARYRNRIVKALGMMREHKVENSAGKSNALNKSNRIKISNTYLGANYVRDNLEEAISLIENGTWPFYHAERCQVPGFTWEAKSSDGIKIIGKVNVNSTELSIVFSTNTIQVRNEKHIERLEKVLCKDIKLGIYEWRDKKKELYGNPKDNVQYDRNSDRYWYRSREINSPCIYCGGATIMGNVCDRCREIYTKKRKGMGGYPSSDPNARGSNGNHFMPE